MLLWSWLVYDSRVSKHLARQLTNMPPLLALLKPFTNSEIRMDSEDLFFQYDVIISGSSGR